jgi:hypothetical protein
MMFLYAAVVHVELSMYINCVYSVDLPAPKVHLRRKCSICTLSASVNEDFGCSYFLVEGQDSAAGELSCEVYDLQL